MASSVSSNFQTIDSWDKAAQFAGRIVAYQTDSFYFGADGGYIIGSNHFGYIEEYPIDWNDPKGKGYFMKKILTPEDMERMRALVTSKLGSHLSMRLATKEEIGLINKAISFNQAKFEYTCFNPKERVAAILERHFMHLDTVFCQETRCALFNVFPKVLIEIVVNYIPSCKDDNESMNEYLKITQIKSKLPFIKKRNYQENVSNDDNARRQSCKKLCRRITSLYGLFGFTKRQEVT